MTGSAIPILQHAGRVQDEVGLVLLPDTGITSLNTQLLMLPPF
jgi:hypothetical protein